ncbi:hypothetical protein [Nonomuraea bangladeshensis]|uniref:hypothetical protein n=1 Tax=Nonomuraea bangladeshensis TaxID=404385 RepID=UPI003C2AD302
MREALFRAAQHSSWVANEESVAQRQSERTTRQIYERSALPLPKPATQGWTGGSASPGVTLLWPYPRGSSDVIDRANCADLFLRAHPRFRIVTEYGLDRGALAETDPAENILLFCPFDAVLPRLSITADSLLTVDDRPVHAVASEMIMGYLMRAGLWPKPARGADFAHLPAIDRLRTGLVNGTGLALFKAAQMALFQRRRDSLSGLGVTMPQGRVAWDRAEAVAASEAWFAQGHGVVYRPFASSRGTAVSFLGPRGSQPRRRAVEEVLDAMEATMADTYGRADPYPITLSTFVESRKIDGRVCDLRMFVVADPQASALRAIPGAVGLAQIPFGERDELGTATCLTNLNAPPDAEAVPIPRELPLSDPDVLAVLGIGEKELELLGRVAVLLWSRAVTAERVTTGMALPFAYGSVDFLITETGRIAPIEMNGANVGSHTSVHPLFLDSFGLAMRAALEEALW